MNKVFIISICIQVFVKYKFSDQLNKYQRAQSLKCMLRLRLALYEITKLSCKVAVSPLCFHRIVLLDVGFLVTFFILPARWRCHPWRSDLHTFWWHYTCSFTEKPLYVMNHFSLALFQIPLFLSFVSDPYFLVPCFIIFCWKLCILNNKIWTPPKKIPLLLKVCCCCSLLLLLFVCFITVLTNSVESVFFYLQLLMHLLVQLCGQLMIEWRFP